MRVIDKEQHPPEEKKKAGKDGIRKSARLNETNCSYLLMVIKIKVEAKAIAPASGKHSTIRILEPEKEPQPLSTKL